ncbi:MAG: NTP transferase domain-containing protein [Promethearchaeota archaeon]
MSQKDIRRRFTLLIMAGGKSSRFDFSKLNLKIREKPMLKIKGTPIIKRILDELKDLKYINRIIVAVSKNTPLTKKFLENLISNTRKNKTNSSHFSSSSSFSSSSFFSSSSPLIFEIFDSPGKNYHEDLKYIIKTAKTGLTLIMTADLPLISSEIIEKILGYYQDLKEIEIKDKKLNLRISARPSLSAMVPKELILSKSIKPSYIFRDKYDRELVPVGINILDDALIDLDMIPQVEYITDDERLLYNINTVEDYNKLMKRLEEDPYLI